VEHTDSHARLYSEHNDQRAPDARYPADMKMLELNDEQQHYQSEGADTEPIKLTLMKPSSERSTMMFN